MVKAERNHLKPPNAVKVKDKPTPEPRPHRTVDVMGEKASKRTWLRLIAKIVKQARRQMMNIWVETLIFAENAKFCPKTLMPASCEKHRPPTRPAPPKAQGEGGEMQ